MLVRAKALWPLLGCRCCVRTHNGDNASADRGVHPAPWGCELPSVGEKSAVVGAVEFANSGGECLQQLA
jgi:hypothetical protein